MQFNRHALAYSLPWNIFLLTFGSFIFIIGYNGIAVHHSFIPAGLYGFAVLGSYINEAITTPQWYLLFNIPIFIIAWKSVGRRFFLLNLYCMLLVTLLTRYFAMDIHIKDPLLAAIAAGIIMGMGTGIILRSFGAGGGFDVLAVILNRKYGLRIGVFYFVINILLISIIAVRFNPDLVVTTLIMLFLSSFTTEYALSMFNQKKAVRIISYKNEEIMQEMRKASRLNGTLVWGTGSYSGKAVSMLFCITDNIRMKQLESIVFDCDPNAIFIVENTFSVIGSNFAPRKTY
ncbi:MAG: YitT family protein [Desulfovibrionales bacterium]|nr:YitT family protein [Desulfovibrionales bacterium]